MRADTTASEALLTERRTAAPRSEQAPPMTAAAFRTWLRRARPGECVTYHHGCLARDRAAGTRLREPERTRLDALAAAILVAADEDRVHLVQRRLGAFDSSYLAIKAGGAPAARLRAVPAPGHRIATGRVAA